MKKLLVVTTVFLINIASIKEVNAEVVDPQTKDNYAECFGSLLVVTRRGAERRFTVSKISTKKFIANSLKVEGCGCFVLYKKAKFKSTARLITHHMGNITGDYIGFTVNSVEKVSCDEYAEAYAQPDWVVVCIVLGLVILVAIIAIVTIKCYRKFNPVPSEDRMMP